MKKIALTAAGAILVAGLLSNVSAFAAVQTTNVEARATVQSTISIATTGDVSITAQPTGAVFTGTNTVTVNTNSIAGYVLNLRATASANLTSGANSITPTTGSFSVPATMGTNMWGYRVDGAGGFGASGAATYAAVTVAGQNIKTTATRATNDTTAVIYGVSVNGSQPSGVYTGQVTYTATTNS